MVSLCLILSTSLGVGGYSCPRRRCNSSESGLRYVAAAAARGVMNGRNPVRGVCASLARKPMFIELRFSRLSPDTTSLKAEALWPASITSEAAASRVESGMLNGNVGSLRFVVASVSLGSAKSASSELLSWSPPFLAGSACAKRRSSLSISNAALSWRSLALTLEAGGTGGVCGLAAAHGAAFDSPSPPSSFPSFSFSLCSHSSSFSLLWCTISTSCVTLLRPALASHAAGSLPCGAPSGRNPGKVKPGARDPRPRGDMMTRGETGTSDPLPPPLNARCKHAFCAVSSSTASSSSSLISSSSSIGSQIADTPKSLILSRPVFVTRRFDGLMSRCTMP
mmetsp:Transcript_7477/g.21131  ORF Transcript_7477/g.21131 Transcript_7477/m.21131 type:complete len:337 (+) Transcript_7477:1388-2398(+)